MCVHDAEKPSAVKLQQRVLGVMERAGLGSGARTIIEECARIKASDVLLRTSAGRDVLLCCVTRPDPAQRALLQRLGLTLPERLGRPAWIPAPQKVETAL